MATLMCDNSPFREPQISGKSWRRCARTSHQIVRTFRSLPYTTHNDYTPGNETGNKLRHDTVLTALGQTAAYRTRCERAFVSLCDQDCQYILAEGVNGGSLGADCVGQTLASSALELKQGICPRTMGHYSENGPVHSSTTMHACYEYCWIRDLASEPKFDGHPFLQGPGPGPGFYFAVPLRDEAGVALGTLSVIDSSPGENLAGEDIKYMQELGQAIMDYLNLIRVRGRFDRADNLIKGLSLFVQDRQQDLHNGANKAFERTPPSGPVIASTKQQSAKTDEKAPVVTISEIDQDSLELSSIVEPSMTTLTSDNSGPLLIEVAGSRTDFDLSEENLSPTLPPSDDVPRRRHNTTRNETHSCTAEASESPDEPMPVKSLFSRASNIIREAAELEGVVFFDATTDRTHAYDDVNQSNGFNSVASTSNSSDEEKVVHNGMNGRSSRKLPTSRASQACEILAFSARDNSGLSQNVDRKLVPRISQDTLQLFLRRYPRGTVFSFDRDGTISSSEEEPSPDQLELHEVASAFSRGYKTAPQWKKQRRRDAVLISEAIPGARSVAFVPMWDYSKDNWVAASLAWSLDPSRVLNEEDLAYFAAFGNSVMIEVSRVEAMLADRSKSNFISSISHEMRSPLHGILGNTELLRDTTISSANHEIVDMIEICGRTLLDTMEHLLDHSKINSLSRKIRNKSSPSSDAVKKYSVLEQNSSVDMEGLVEDVVSTVYAGHVHSSSTSTLFHMAGTAAEKFLENESVRKVARTAIDNTTIIVQIDRCSCRPFSTQPGVWKRLLMNMLGNALKYTQTGFILVRLQTEEISLIDCPPQKARLTLSVADTGRGIARDYLKHRVFKPFSQENNLDVGAGLGLSIVKQLALTMGAQVDLRSEVGVGTTISVSVELDLGPSAPSSQTRLQRLIIETGPPCLGKEVCFLGFDLLPNLSVAPDGELSVQSQGLIVLKAALSTLLVDSLGMHVTTAASAEKSSADIFFVHESYFSTDSKYNPSSLLESAPPNRPYIVLCKGNGNQHPAEPNTLYVQHPCMPSKIIAGILKCLRDFGRPNQAHTSRDPTLQLVSPVSVPVHSVDDGFRNEAKPETAPEGKRLALELKDTVKTNLRQQMASAGTAALNTSPTVKQYRVLVVDDNIINVKLLASFMRKMGHVYLTAANGAEAVQQYSSSAPDYFDLILMDISMPVMDGFEATRRIREIELQQKLRPTHIIALTGLGSGEAKQAAVLCGIDVFVTKPASFRRLKELIDDHVPAQNH